MHTTGTSVTPPSPSLPEKGDPGLGAAAAAGVTAGGEACGAGGTGLGATRSGLGAGGTGLGTGGAGLAAGGAGLGAGSAGWGATGSGLRGGGGRSMVVMGRGAAGRSGAAGGGPSAGAPVCTTRGLAAPGAAAARRCCTAISCCSLSCICHACSCCCCSTARSLGEDAIHCPSCRSNKRDRGGRGVALHYVATTVQHQQAQQVQARAQSTAPAAAGRRHTGRRTRRWRGVCVALRGCGGHQHATPSICSSMLSRGCRRRHCDAHMSRAHPSPKPCPAGLWTKAQLSTLCRLASKAVDWLSRSARHPRGHLVP